MGSKRDEYISKAIELMGVYGIEGISVRRLTDSLNVSEAALYRHFESKEALLSEAFLTIDRNLTDIFVKTVYLNGFSGQPFRGIFKEAWKGVFEYLLASRNETAFITRFLCSSMFTPDVCSKRAIMTDEFRHVLQLCRDHLADGDGELYTMRFHSLMNITVTFAYALFSRTPDADSISSHDIYWPMLSEIIDTIFKDRVSE